MEQLGLDHHQAGWQLACDCKTCALLQMDKPASPSRWCYHLDLEAAAPIPKKLRLVCDRALSGLCPALPCWCYHVQLASSSGWCTAWPHAGIVSCPPCWYYHVHPARLVWRLAPCRGDYLMPGRPPQEPAFLLAFSTAFLAAASASLRAASSLAARWGSVIRRTARATFVPLSMVSSGSFLSLRAAQSDAVSTTARLTEAA
jgi:hypothetical protein